MSAMDQKVSIVILGSLRRHEAICSDGHDLVGEIRIDATFEAYASDAMEEVHDDVSATCDT